MLLFVCLHAYQDHLEVLDVSSSSANHSPIDRCPQHVEARGGGSAVLLACDGIPHQDLSSECEEDQYKAMAASDQPKAEAVIAVVELQGEASLRDTIGGLQGWCEDEVSVEEAKERSLPKVVDAKSTEEAGVGGESAPALGDEGSAREG
jgi:hypothetical protein